MTKKSTGAKRQIAAPASAARRIRKSMVIDGEKLAKARSVLRSESDAHTIDQALDLVIANCEIKATVDFFSGSVPGFKVS